MVVGSNLLPMFRDKVPKTIFHNHLVNFAGMLDYSKALSVEGVKGVTGNRDPEIVWCKYENTKRAALVNQTPHPTHWPANYINQ